MITTSGHKSFGESEIAWRCLKRDSVAEGLEDYEIAEDYGFCTVESEVPGQQYAKRALVTKSLSRVLIKQWRGWDV